METNGFKVGDKVFYECDYVEGIIVGFVQNGIQAIIERNDGGGHNASIHGVCYDEHGIMIPDAKEKNKRNQTLNKYWFCSTTKGQLKKIWTLKDSK